MRGSLLPLLHLPPLTLSDLQIILHFLIALPSFNQALAGIFKLLLHGLIILAVTVSDILDLEENPV